MATGEGAVATSTSGVLGRYSPGTLQEEDDGSFAESPLSPFPFFCFYFFK